MITEKKQFSEMNSLVFSCITNLILPLIYNSAKRIASSKLLNVLKHYDVINVNEKKVVSWKYAIIEIVKNFVLAKLFFFGV